MPTTYTLAPIGMTLVAVTRADGRVIPGYVAKDGQRYLAVVLVSTEHPNLDAAIAALPLLHRAIRVKRVRASREARIRPFIANQEGTFDVAEA